MTEKKLKPKTPSSEAPTRPDIRMPTAPDVSRALPCEVCGNSTQLAICPVDGNPMR